MTPTPDRLLFPGPDAELAELRERLAQWQAANEELQREQAHTARIERVVRQIHVVGLPKRMPHFGALHFAVSNRDGWFDVVRLDESHVGFWVADPGGGLIGRLIGLALRQAIHGSDVLDTGTQIVSPSEVLTRANRVLVALELEPSPLVGFGYGVIDVRTGEVSVARAGIPPLVYIPASEQRDEHWGGPGPFLGAFDAAFMERTGRLLLGDRLILATAGDPGQLARIRQLPADAAEIEGTVLMMRRGA